MIKHSGNDQESNGYLVPNYCSYSHRTFVGKRTEVELSESFDSHTSSCCLTDLQPCLQGSPLWKKKKKNVGNGFSGLFLSPSSQRRKRTRRVQ